MDAHEADAMRALASTLLLGGSVLLPSTEKRISAHCGSCGDAHPTVVVSAWSPGRGGSVFGSFVVCTACSTPWWNTRPWPGTPASVHAWLEAVRAGRGWQLKGRA